MELLTDELKEIDYNLNWESQIILVRKANHPSDVLLIDE